MHSIPSFRRTFSCQGTPLSVVLLAGLILAPLSTQGQALASADIEETTSSSTANGSGPAGIIPVARGFNLTLGTSSQHDSSNGWSSVLNPGFSYRLNRYLSADATLPVYAYINVEANTGTRAKPIYTYLNKRGVLGDTSLAVHLDLQSFADYTGSFTLGLPSGNSNFGLGAGQTTYDFNNHFDHSFGIVTPDLEVGFGDSTSLVNRRVRKSYTAVGNNLHFQAGTSLDLPFNLSFSADAYEQLPVSTTTISSTTGRGKKKRTTTSSVSSGEDNGFITSLDVPLNRHTSLSGFYNRSLRAHDDVAGFSFTFLLKAPPHANEPH